MSDELGVPGGSAPEPTQLPGSEILDNSSGALNVTPLQTHRASGPKKRWVLPAVGASVLMIAVASAGVALGVMVSGGGTQPEELVPANAMIYADVDFDPAAGQKANLMRLINKFPDLQDQLGGSDDIKQVIVEGLLKDFGSNTANLNSDEVLSWLGDRAGVAVIPGDNDQSVGMVAVLQVTDEDAAQASLESVVNDSQIAFDSGYVVLTTDQADFSDFASSSKPLVAADVLASAKQSPLSENPNFTNVIDPLGDGIASGYVDLAGVTRLTKGLAGPMGMMGMGSLAGLDPSQAGQVGAVLRVDPSDVEFEARSTAVSADGVTAPTTLFTGLPQNTAAAVDFVGGGDNFQAQWDKFLKEMDQLGSMGFSDVTGNNGPSNAFEHQIAKIEARYNVRLPDDIETLLGNEFLVAVSGDGLVGPIPSMGTRSITDPAKAADMSDRLQPVIDDLTAGLGVTLQPTDDGLVIASTPDYAKTLSAGDGGIMDNPAVARALPDADGATAVAWVDLDVLGDLANLASPEDGAVIAPLEGFGITVHQDTDGQTIQARLTFNE